MESVITGPSGPPQPGADAAPTRLGCLLDVSQAINSTLDLTTVLDHILRQASAVLEAESGSIMLLDEGGELRVLAARGPRADRVYGRAQRLGEGIAGWVVLHGRPVLLRGAAPDPRFERVCARHDVRDALCVPLRVGGRVLGVISLSNRLTGHPFSNDDLDLLTALSNHAALAIRNARSYDQIEMQRKTLAKLLEELTRAQEEERMRIALQIHDGPAQTLFAALRYLEAARVATVDPGDARNVMDELEGTVRRAIDEIRAVMIDLRPLILDDIGLYAALRQYARQFEKRTGIRTRVVRKGLDRRLPAMMEASFYRIAQEALTNAWKHAGALHARVVLEVQESRCALEIADDGKGLDAEAARQSEGEHMGMDSLRERAEILGGSLTVRGATTGAGTVVRVVAPLVA